jgi:peptidylprolyl isomerase
LAGECGAVSRKKGAPRLHFRGVALHRIVPGFLCQGGDITHDRDGTGLGGASVYGGTFEDEGFPLKHRGRGELLMANAGRAHNNHSQFAITMARITEFESGHVIFGRVLDGFEALRLAELEGSAEGFTERPVVIHDCGELDARGEAIEVVGGDSVVRRRPELSDAQVRYFTTRILRGALACEGCISITRDSISAGYLPLFICSCLSLISRALLASPCGAHINDAAMFLCVSVCGVPLSSRLSQLGALRRDRPSPPGATCLKTVHFSLLL